MWTPSAQLHLYLIYVTNHWGRFPSQPKARQRSLNTDDLCFWERAAGCQTHSRLCEMAEDVSRWRGGVDGGWVCGALSTGWGMLFVCDVLEHLEEMIGQSAINRRSRSPAARAPCGAARRGRWAGGVVFFSESWVQREGREQSWKNLNLSSAYGTTDTDTWWIESDLTVWDNEG